MIRFDLRTKIAATIFVLVAVATLLINFVLVVALQKALVQEHVLRGRAALASLHETAAHFGTDRSNLELSWIRNGAGADAVVLVDTDGRLVLSGLITEMRPLLVKLAKTAGASRRSAVAFHGQTWGVFWRQPRFALISTPVGTGGAGAAMALSLEGVYRTLRGAQKVLFVYLLINAGLLTLLGVLRISHLAVKPIERLLKRAETYQGDGSVLFSSERGDSEFNRLSRALNRLLQRVSEDRETLRETVRSLEQTNLDLKKAQNDIIQAEKLASVGRLSSGIAHEIGNPIGIVLGYLDLLRQSEISEEERNDYIQRAEAEINRISTILRQLLDFSRPSSGDSENVSVHSVLTDMVEIVKVQPLMAQVSIRLALSAKKDRVQADPNQLRQVFLNLMINAADAVSLPDQTEAGRLDIGSEELFPEGKDGYSGSPMLKIWFADNGPGIDEKDIGNIFDPFFTTKAPGKGTGLGLSVCFMIVENMGGRIFAESLENGGTVITLYLPLVSGDVS